MRSTTPPAIASEDVLMTVPEAARELDVSRFTVRMMFYRDELPGRQVGRIMLFRRADVLRVKDARAMRPRPRAVPA